MTIDQVIQKIAHLEYKLFVVNTYAAGIQQNDGRYIKQKVMMSPFVIENMILQFGSMGCYQQGYKTDRIKWICFDFDCKDKDNPDLDTLYYKYIAPFTSMLEEMGIRYLTEFSGRRGIHVWILFHTLLTKRLGFHILCELEKRCPIISEIKENAEWGLDKFPATDSSKNNIVGKQVKFPLSCHRSGTRSYFFTGEFQRKADTFSDSFLLEQLEILEQYEPNSVSEVVEKLNMKDTGNEPGLLKYRKYRLLGNIEITTDQIINILSETVVFQQLFHRMSQGLALPSDWTVLLGTLSLCDSNAQILKSIFQRFPNYDEEKTCENIEKLGKKYFPATFGYLYYLYDLPMESWLDPNETGLHYLLRRAGVDSNFLIPFEEINEKKTILDLGVTVNKEKNYLKENDEVSDVSIWNHLLNLKKYDLFYYEQLIAQVLSGENPNFVPTGYIVYERIESAEKTRTLVSLSAKERVITTNLALRLCSILKSTWKSFSYHVSYVSCDHIFAYWYSSWGKFIEHIRTFIEMPFMGNYEVFYLDLKGFYDHIDFLSVYRTFEGILNEEAKNIFIFLTEYNDKLMKQLHHGNRIGVPQGPAYARIIAEMFLDQILEKVYKKFDRSGFYTYRYVDDIVFFCRPDFDGITLYETLKTFLVTCGLPINYEKSRYFGRIDRLTKEEKRMLLHEDSFNYELKENEYTGMLFDNERRQKLRDYLTENEFQVSSLSYIFGSNTFSEAQIYCMEHFRQDILKSCEGRGRNFRKFYEYLFQSEIYVEKMLNEGEFSLIPLDSLNFSNFIHTLYYSVQKKDIAPSLFDRIKNEYLAFLPETELMESDSAIVNALMMIKAEVPNEKN